MRTQLRSMVRGAVSGALATVPMTVAMGAMHRTLPWWQFWALPPREITSNTLDALGVRYTLPTGGESLATVIGHFGYGTAAGALYGALPRARDGSPVLNGLAYGLCVWAVSYGGWLPAARLAAPLRRRTPERVGLMIAAHAVWGIALGLMVHGLEYRPDGVDRSQNSTGTPAAAAMDAADTSSGA